MDMRLRDKFAYLVFSILVLTATHSAHADCVERRLRSIQDSIEVGRFKGNPVTTVRYISVLVHSDCKSTFRFTASAQSKDCAPSGNHAAWVDIQLLDAQKNPLTPWEHGEPAGVADGGTATPHNPDITAKFDQLDWRDAAYINVAGSGDGSCDRD